MYDVPTEVKTALKDGGYKKNYRFDVYEEVEQREIFTIDNDTLVSESVSFDERMNSGKNLKFGLCEGTSLEFQYFNHPNINGRTLKAFVDVQYPHTVPGEKVPLFSVDLQGDAPYTFEESKNYYMRFFNDSETAVKIWITDENEQFIDGILLSSHEYNEITVRIPADGQMTAVPSTAGAVVNVSTQVYEQLPDTKTLAWQTIPMGTFTVDEVSRQASTGIMKATAYNKLMSDYLDQKANLIVNEQFGSTVSLKVGALIRLMLKDYRIDADRQDVEPVVPVTPGSGSWLPYEDADVYCKSIIPVSPKTYGVDTPLNSNRYGSALKYFGSYSRKMGFDADNQDLFMDFQKGTFASFERAVYNFLKSVIDAAQLKDGNGNIVTGQQILDDICANSNFAYIVGIESIPSSGSNNFYSTIQWEYEETHGLQHKVSGNSNDALATLTKGLIIMPYTYGLCRYNDASDLLSGAYSYDGTTNYSYGVGYWGTYQYYTDSSQTLSETKTAPLFYYKDELYPTNTEVVELYWKAYIIDPDGIDSTIVTLADMPDYTLRDIQSAIYEAECQYGQLDRETDLFSGVELSQGAPVETISKDMYSKLWADEGNIRKWKYLIITYKGLDGEGNETEYTLQRTVNSDGTDNYNMSDNWLFRNLVWTAAQVGEYADAMVQKMQDITWFPFEAWTAGLPYLETGDKVAIPLGVETYTSYVLQRTLKGIQNLQDTYINGELDIF